MRRGVKPGLGVGGVWRERCHLGPVRFVSDSRLQIRPQHQLKGEDVGPVSPADAPLHPGAGNPVRCPPATPAGCGPVRAGPAAARAWVLGGKRQTEKCGE